MAEDKPPKPPTKPLEEADFTEIEAAARQEQVQLRQWMHAEVSMFPIIFFMIRFKC